MLSVEPKKAACKKELELRACLKRVIKLEANCWLQWSIKKDNKKIMQTANKWSKERHDLLGLIRKLETKSNR